MLEDQTLSTDPVARSISDSGASCYLSLLTDDNVYVLYISCIFPLFCYAVTQVRLSFVQ